MWIQIRQRRVEPHAPVHEVVRTIENAVIVQLTEHLDDRLRQALDGISDEREGHDRPRTSFMVNATQSQS